MKNNFIYFLSVVLVISIITTCVYLFLNERNKPICSGCNVVIIDIDVLREDVLNCDGDRVATVNLCGILKNSVRFRNNISHSDYTFPAFLSGLTSLYPSSHNMWNPLRDKLSKNVVTIQKVFGESGYYTVLAGPLEDENIYSDGFDVTIHTANFFKDEHLPEILEKASSQDKPFLLYVYSNDLHMPYFVPEDVSHRNVQGEKPEKLPANWDEYNSLLEEYLAVNYTEVFKDEVIIQNQNIFQGSPLDNKEQILDLFFELWRNNRELLINAWFPQYDSLVQTIDTSKPEQVEYIKSRYFNALWYIDISLSQLLGILNTDEYKDKTIIVIKSDHGEEFFEHGKFSHNNKLYQELLQTPLAFRIPGLQSKEFYSFSQDIDIFPTLLDLVNIEIPEQIQGKSLLSVIEGKTQSVNEYQIAERREGDSASFRKGDWKILIDDGVVIELYNLADDAEEKNNLVDKEAEQARLLYKRYSEVMRSLEKFKNPESSFPDWIDEEKRKRLIEEGYF